MPLTVDASVAIKWYLPHAEPDTGEALDLERQMLAGTVELIAPSLLALEVLNSVGRRHAFPAEALEDVGSALADSGLTWSEPDLDRVASWINAGLSAYDAAYVAVAEQHDTRLVTADQQILSVCERAVDLPTWAAGGGRGPEPV